MGARGVRASEAGIALDERRFAPPNITPLVFLPLGRAVRIARAWLWLYVYLAPMCCMGIVTPVVWLWSHSPGAGYILTPLSYIVGLFVVTVSVK